MITHYAHERNINLDGLQVDVIYDNEATPSSVGTVIHLPDGLSADQITRLQRVADTCPVKRALEAGFTFDTELAITTTAGSSSTELARRSSRPRRSSPRSITPAMSTRTNVSRRPVTRSGAGLPGLHRKLMRKSWPKMEMGRFEKRFVNSARHSSRVAERAQQLVRTANPQPGQRLLDVGCGNGTAAVHLAEALRLAVTGVDIDTDQIAAAELQGDGLPAVRFLVADATTLPFADDEFDIVFTSKTTHHIPEWQRALAEMTRVLKPDGYLLYSDFVAPLGHRLPTRRALNRFADQHALEAVRRSKSPFHFTGVFRKRSQR